MKWLAIPVALLALGGAVLFERHREAQRAAAGPEDPVAPFRALHDAGLATLDPALFEAALAVAPPDLDRDLYARAIGWLRAGRCDLAIAGFRESSRVALGAPVE